MSGYVTFLMGGREMAGRLLEVREVVRAVGVEPLAGIRAPVTGLLILRDLPLPVVDLRTEADAGDVGDVLVLVPDGGGALGSRGRPRARCARAGRAVGDRRRPRAIGGAARLRARGAAQLGGAAGLRRQPARPGRLRPRLSGSDVALEDRRLREAGEAFAHGAGPRLADALDGLQVVDAGGEQLLQAAEVLDEPVDDQARAAAARGPAAGSRAG